MTARGYSLSGRTATAVIPPGTRLTIPGYGEGIAADTGGAVTGAMIDLWFPTRAQALVWGRRSVTVTLH